MVQLKVVVIQPDGHVTQSANQATEILIDGLSSDTKYYYKFVYSTNGGATPWTERAEHSFHTQRAAGNTYEFTITADSHI